MPLAYVGCHPKLSGGACCFVCSMDADTQAGLCIHQEKERKEGKCCVLTCRCLLVIFGFSF